MSSPSDYTQADLTAVRAARKSGIRTVQYETRSVTYASMAELKDLENDILKALGQGRSRQTLGFHAGKGFA